MLTIALIIVFQFSIPKRCNLEDLNLKPTEDIIKCYPERDVDNFAMDGSRCLLSVNADNHLEQNKMALTQCERGSWKTASLGMVSIKF